MIPEPTREDQQQKRSMGKGKSIGIVLAAVAAVVLLLGGIRFYVNYQMEQDLNQQLEEWLQPATYAPPPTPSLRPTPTPALRPTPTPAFRPTPTPPPVSVNPDCIGCNVAMPREVATPSLALRDYGAPDKLLLVTCSQGYSVDGNLVMGPLRSSGSRVIVVQGLKPEDVDHDDGCVAITALYVGTELYPYGHTEVSILTFKVAGEVTGLTTSQYHTMKQYAAIAR